MGLAYRGEYANPQMVEYELDLIDARLSRSMRRTEFPVGGGCLWFTDSAPSSDWILCQGQPLNQVEYPALYALWGGTYGGGGDDGLTQFSAPDLRSRFMLGNAGVGTASTLADTGTFAASGTTQTYLVVNFAVRAR